MADSAPDKSFKELTEQYRVLAKIIESSKAEDRRLSCTRLELEKSRAEVAESLNDADGSDVEPLRKPLDAIEKDLLVNREETNKNLKIESKVQEEATALR